MPVSEASILTLLRERAGMQGEETAFTYIDYERDWDGVPENLTFAQLYRRTRNVAHALERHGAAGDRAVLLAPQGLDYIVAFLGAIQAGRIAVPLSVPMGGVSDERVSSVLLDASPSVVLTTSSVADTVTEHVNAYGGASIVAVDELDLDGRPPAGDPVKDSGTAYLQYTSGSTRRPAGVMMSHRNLLSNFEQLMSAYFADRGGMAPPGSTIVSWLPFYHDMGLYLGVFAPVLAGVRAVLTSPVAFLQRPARWVQLMAENPSAYSAAPNFAFELAVRKTSDADMAGRDLSDVLVIVTGSERVHPAALDRFSRRFAPFNLDAAVIRPSYGLAEATVFVAAAAPGLPPVVARFESEQLTAGKAQRSCTGGTPLVSYRVPRSPLIRVVDPETCVERPPATVGEIWVSGENVAAGYWQKPAETESVFGGRLVDPPAGVPEGPWLRTGDLGFVSDGELFVIGRIKDLLIVYGRNHSPDDIEATVQEITGGRCAAVGVTDGQTEKLVVIVETRARGDSPVERMAELTAVKGAVASAISAAHGLAVTDLVLVQPGSLPITTSGKIRRAECAEQYRQGKFARLDV